jgi:hypothetical protein
MGSSTKYHHFLNKANQAGLRRPAVDQVFFLPCWPGQLHLSSSFSFFSSIKAPASSVGLDDLDVVSTFKVWTTWMLLALLTIWQQPQTHQVLKLMKHW